MNKTPEHLPLFDDDPAEPAEDANEPLPVPEQQTAEILENSPELARETLDEDAMVAAAEEFGDADAGVFVDDSVARPAPDAAAATATSTARHAVGTADEMDAWLSGASQPVANPWLVTDAEADAAMAAWLAADPNAPQVSEDGPVIITGGRLERLRPKRSPLVPVWLIWVVLAVLLIGGMLAGGAAYFALRARVFVPTVAGLQTPAARDRLATVGLELAVSDRRFSTLPVDTILTQNPEAGARTKQGSTVAVVVSAGTEEFTMPDVVGTGLTLARSQLEQKGLQVQIEAVASDQPSDTVLASNPAAGATVRTGDIVNLTVAMGAGGTGGGSTPTTGALVPYTLTGVLVTLDPAPPVSGQPDSALEVSRRLQSLLEASGAKVSTTRSIADTGATGSVTARQLKAGDTSATVAVGFDVTSQATAGVALLYPSPTVAASVAAPSQMLSSQISSALAGQAINARQEAGGSDVVLSATNAPYVRMTLGSTASREDLANFGDPNWADKAARAAYQGIAAIYGIRNAGGF